MKAARKQHQKKPAPGQPQVVTRAVTHIRLEEANVGKLAALDALAPVYLALCQQYIDLFCTLEPPNKLRDPCYATPLSERWHRVAIMQAAGIAQAWRTNRARAEQDYQQEAEAFQEELEAYQEQQARGACDPGEKAIKAPKAPIRQKWNVPTLRQWCLQANVNVAKLEPSQESTFEYWLTVATLEKGHPIKIPVKLAAYHKEVLQDKKINSSVQLNKRGDGWWLALSYDETVISQTSPEASVVGIDVGLANFITTSDGKHYGTMHGKIRERHKRDREKRRRKAKLRACLKKKNVKKLPSTSSRSGQRLIRHTKQEINHAVKQCFAEHEDAQFAYEQLSVASMRFKARAMNSYLRASNLAHIPHQIEWNSTKRGVMATPVKSAYSSQECSRCHYTHRENRLSQQTFCCQACGYKAHADFNASVNISRRVGDRQLRACKDRKAIKALLMKRHEQWKERNGKEERSLVKRKRRRASSGSM